MGLPVTIAALILLIAGLSILLTGLFLRHGTRPSCRACGYDLSALAPARCPECNADLAARGAIRIGDRRKPLVRVGAAIAMLALAGLIYTFVHAPGLDQRKPLWLLRAELAMVNTKGQERVVQELQRRLSSQATPLRERIAIGSLALNRAFGDSPSSAMYDLFFAAARAGALPPKRAEVHARELLVRWPDNLIQNRARSQDKSLHANMLGSLLSAAEIEFDAVQPVIDQCLSRMTTNLPDHDFAQLSATILRGWSDSPGAPAIATDDFLLQLYQDSPRLSLETRGRIEDISDIIPFSVHVAVPPALCTKDDGIYVGVRPVKVKILQHDRPIYEEGVRLGGAIMQLQGDQRYPRFESGGFGTGLTVNGLSPGPAELLMEVRTVIVRDDGLTNSGVSLDDLFDPAKSHILIDRTATLRAELNIVPAGGDTVALLVPGEGDTPTARAVVERLRFTPLRYSTEQPFGSQGPWYFGWKLIPLRHDLLAQADWLWPKVDLSYRVIAEQDDLSWNLGTITARDVMRRGSDFTPMAQRRTPARRTESGTLEWTEPAPDFNRPVRIRLMPAPELARRTVDVTSIFGGELDLGQFMVLPVEGQQSEYSYSDADNPAPILSE